MASVTIKDIAKVAEVSHTTVSRALKGNPAISSETTQRIRDLAEEMGYTPNAVAQSLQTRRTQTIGMVVTSVSDPFVSRVVAGVETIAHEAGYSVFLCSSHNNPAKEIDVVQTLARRRVDAIIVTSSRIGSLYTTQLEQIEVPVVIINNNQDGGDYLHSIQIDDVKAAETAVSHLTALGHQRIGYIHGKNRPLPNQNRLQGYRQALQKAALPLDDRLIIQAVDTVDFQNGQAALPKLREAQATAAFCFNDLTAIGLLAACHHEGLSIPKQLSIVGFDNIDTALYTLPTLTTMHQPRLRMGQQATMMALNLLNKKPVEDKILECDLIIRGSTAPPN